MIRTFNMQRRDWQLVALLFTLLAYDGCSSSPAPLTPPTIDSDAPNVAISSYDSNKDGAIGSDELNKVPSLKAALKRVDSNKDGRVTADEIAERIALWRKSEIALTRAVVHVRKNGQPLQDVEVFLVPEEFLGPALRPARGKSDSGGATHVRISDDRDEAGVQLGYFRVQLSKKGADGKETIPARYNTESELGVEITPDDPNLAHLTFDIAGQ